MSRSHFWTLNNHLKNAELTDLMVSGIRSEENVPISNSWIL